MDKPQRKYNPYGMSEKQLEEYQRYFFDQDTDGDGQLSKQEFASMLNSMGLMLSPAEMNKLFQKTDKDQSSKISFHEFANAFFAKKKKEGLSEDQIQRIFNNSDQNKDGFLTNQECFFALKQLGHVLDDKGVKRIMSIMDKNNDGRISYEGIKCLKTNSRKSHGVGGVKKVEESATLYKIIRPKLSKRESEDLKALFDTFDEDGNGSISTKELKVVLSSLNIHVSQEDLDILFKTADKDQSGCIEFWEFEAAFTKHLKPPSEDQLMICFQRFDKNKDGYLSREEIKEVLRISKQPATDKAVADMIRVADKNGDGKINYREFLDMLKR